MPMKYFPELKVLWVEDKLYDCSNPQSPRDITPWRSTIVQVFKTRSGGLLCRSSEGDVFGLGSNLWGELGSEQEKLDNITKIALPGDFKTKLLFSGPEDNTFALTYDHRLVGWGDNGYGNLGLSVERFLRTAQEITLPYGAKVTAIVFGDGDVFLITTDNQLLSCGFANWGQLGRSTVDDITKKPNNNIFNPVVLRAGIEPKQVIPGCRSYSTFMISTNDELFAWGLNYNGQAGLGNDISYTDTPHQIMSNVRRVFPQDRRTAVITNSDEMYVFGDYSSSNLGFGIVKTPTKLELPHGTKPEEVIFWQEIFFVITNGRRVLVTNKKHQSVEDTLIEIFPDATKIKQVIADEKYNNVVFFITDKNELFVLSMNAEKNKYTLNKVEPTDPAENFKVIGIDVGFETDKKYPTHIYTENGEVFEYQDHPTHPTAEKIIDMTQCNPDVGFHPPTNVRS